MLMRVKYDGQQLTIRPDPPESDCALRSEPEKLLAEPPASEIQAKVAWEAEWKEQARAPFNVIQIENAKYYLKDFATPVVCKYSKELFKLFLPGFPRRWEGEGESASAALESWIYRFHRRFQRLWPRRPDDMTPADRIEWDAIEARVDVRRTLAEQPVASARPEIGVSPSMNGRSNVW
jgi:hypothetical protein